MSVRTNAIICIGKIAQYLSEDVRVKTLLIVTQKALKDPFGPAKCAGGGGAGAGE